MRKPRPPRRPSRGTSRFHRQPPRTGRPGSPVRPPAQEGGTAPVSVGEVLDLEISDIAFEGDPFGRVENYVIFCEGTIPGERVRVKVVSANRKFARAVLVQTLRKSPQRVVPACVHHGACGGCSWQHIAYARQLELKHNLLVELLGRTSLVARAVLPTVGLDGSGRPKDPRAPWGFRSKTHFVLGPGGETASLTFGHYRRGSHEILEIEECPVHAAAGNSHARRVQEALLRYGIPGTDEAKLRGLARHVVVRTSEATGQSQVTVVATRADTRRLKGALREIASGSGAPGGLHLNVHVGPGPFLFGKETTRIAGDSRLLEEVGGAEFLLSPRSFFQTSSQAAGKLLGVVLEAVPAGYRGKIVDLYAGVGLFALPLARRGQKVIAVEENPTAVADGIASLRKMGLQPSACRFVRARVEDWLRDEEAVDLMREQAIVILDPPREGCPRPALERLVGELRPSRLVYVSCNARALADDLQVVVGAGYRPVWIRPVDMFPHTPHIEAVAVFDAPAP